MNPKHSSFRDKLIALESIIMDRDPLFSATCAVPAWQRFLYFLDGDHFRRIDFSSAGKDELDTLYRVCKPEFGWNGENNFDESSLGKAGRMDLTSFATPFDPRSLGIYEQVSNALFPDGDATRTEMDLELCKLNVYGIGDFFRLHEGTPRSQGSLIVVLSTPHEGGQWLLHKDRKRWTIDFADTLAAATEPLACFIAFSSDVKLELSPITSGYCMTLTYSLYRKPIGTHPSTSSIPTPYHQKLKQAVVDLVNDKSVLPNGGYLGFALAHDYVRLGRKMLVTLRDQLKGSDRALANVCEALGLCYSLKFLYREFFEEVVPNLNLITTDAFIMRETESQLESGDPTSLQECLNGHVVQGLTFKSVEGVNFVGDESKMDPSGELNWLEPYYKDPIAEVLEVTPIESSPVTVAISCLVYVSGASLMSYHGKGCILVPVEPADSRKLVG